MSSIKSSIISIFAAGLIFGLIACEKKGPMEKAGESVDKAIEKTEKAIKEKTE